MAAADAQHPAIVCLIYMMTMLVKLLKVIGKADGLLTRESGLAAVCSPQEGQHGCG